MVTSCILLSSPLLCSGPVVQKGPKRRHEVGFSGNTRQLAAHRHSPVKHLPPSDHCTRPIAEANAVPLNLSFVRGVGMGKVLR